MLKLCYKPVMTAPSPALCEGKEMKDFKQLLQESTDAIERQIEELRKERAEFKEYLKTLQAKADKVPRVEQ